MNIKVLGAGCASCHALEERTVDALARIGAEASVEMVTDYGAILGYGVMSTPALIVDDTVVVSGRVPGVDELASILSGSVAAN
jgi:small redox-active disulfide protein 2